MAYCTFVYNSILCIFAGIEIKYELYNPLIQKIEILKLEKRLDDRILYLRDAALHYSYVPFDLHGVPVAVGGTVPINPIKVYHALGQTLLFYLFPHYRSTHENTPC